MAVKTPVKATFTGSDVTGLAEYQAADFIGVVDGGTGAATFAAGILKADGTNAFTTVTAPSGTIVGTSDTQTLTNKTINSASNTITITESNISDLQSYITASSTNTLTNKTFDANGTGNSLSNIEVADFATGVVDTDLTSVSISDDTLASAKAIKTYIDSQVTAQDLDFSADTGGALSIDLDSESLTFTGGTGIDTSGSGNIVTFAIDSTVATLTGTQTLTNKTLTSPIISTISNTGSLTLPTSTDTLVGRATTDTLTNKTINSASNTITITESNISDLGSYITASSTDTLTNKSISLTNNTISGTTAEFNTALSDGSFATLAGTETLTNKTISGSSNTLSNIGNASLTNSSITVTDGSTSTATSLGGTITFSGTANEVEVGESSGTITIGLPNDVTVGNNLTVTGNLTVSGTTTTVNSTTVEIQNAFVFEGATADAFETTLTTVDPTADRTISLPNATGTIVLKDTTDTLTNKTINTASNTITIVEADISDLQSYILAGSTDTLTNKTISLTNNTISGTTAEFNSALSDGSFATLAGTETLTNKTISGTSNTITGLNATSIADGSISNTEFQYLNGVTSNIQSQLDAKASTAFAIAQAVALG